MAGSGHPADPPAEATFEDLMAELEEITERLAAGDLGIEAAADLYERAERLHALAAQRLAQVQARVEALTRPAGAPSTPAGANSAGAPGASPAADQPPAATT